MSYKIVRFYKDSYYKKPIKKGLTLEEAQAHCSDPETSSSTCKSSKSLAVTRRNGHWFDGYTTQQLDGRKQGFDSLASTGIQVPIVYLIQFIMRYEVRCPSAPFENSSFLSLGDCWGLCLELSEEYGYAEVRYGACLMGSYTNGQ